MARPVVGNPFENQIPTVSPTASPVDIYVRGTEKRSAMAGLADTLKRFSQRAVPVLGGLEQQAAEREILELQSVKQSKRALLKKVLVHTSARVIGFHKWHHCLCDMQMTLREP